MFKKKFDYHRIIKLYFKLFDIEYDFIDHRSAVIAKKIKFFKRDNGYFNIKLDLFSYAEMNKLYDMDDDVYELGFELDDEIDYIHENM